MVATELCYGSQQPKHLQLQGFRGLGFRGLGFRSYHEGSFARPCLALENHEPSYVKHGGTINFSYRLVEGAAHPPPPPKEGPTLKLLGL